MAAGHKRTKGKMKKSPEGDPVQSNTVRRFRVEVVDIEHEAGYVEYEHRVVERATNRVVLSFKEFGTAHAGVDPTYEGVRQLSIDVGETHVIVQYHDDDETKRVPLAPRQG